MMSQLDGIYDWDSRLAMVEVSGTDNAHLRYIRQMGHEILRRDELRRLTIAA
jgi:hypothetical protein